MTDMETAQDTMLGPAKVEGKLKVDETEQPVEETKQPVEENKQPVEENKQLVEENKQPVEEGELKMSVRRFMSDFKTADIAHGILDMAGDWYVYLVETDSEKTRSVCQSLILGVQEYYSHANWKCAKLKTMMTLAHPSLRLTPEQRFELPGNDSKETDWASFCMEKKISYMSELPHVYESRLQQARHKKWQLIPGYNDSGPLRKAWDAFCIEQCKVYLWPYSKLTEFIVHDPARFKRAIKKFRGHGWWFTVEYIKEQWSKRFVSLKRTKKFRKFQKKTKKNKKKEKKEEKKKVKPVDQESTLKSSKADVDVTGKKLVFSTPTATKNVERVTSVPNSQVRVLDILYRSVHILIVVYMYGKIIYTYKFYISIFR